MPVGRSPSSNASWVVSISDPDRGSDGMNKLTTWMTSAVLGTLLTSAAVADEPDAFGSILIKASDGSYEITATVNGRSATALEVEAKLAVTKSDASGSVKTRQSRTVMVDDQKEEQVALTRVSLDRSGMLEVALTIEKDGVVIDRVVHTVSRNPSD